MGGSAETAGDLKSVVLHKMTLAAHKSTFPIALGMRLTGVDDQSFSRTGECYSMIAMPHADSHKPRVLQEDNTELVRIAHTHTHTHRHAHAPYTERARGRAGVRIRAQVSCGATPL